ncbi:MAG TPA: CbiX/SirB N-terminal domain-containing protein [Gemmatimonadales bacterium]|nr:CbiX/SirB N-terminal domain-containing protein [Gemmatimonadales bacterium]
MYFASPRPFTRLILTLSCLSLVFLTPLRAQAEPAATVGVLVVAHGADSAWNARVDAVVAAVEWPGPVETVYLMGSAAESRSWDRAVARLAARGATRAIAVPLMVSSYGAHVRQMQYYAGERPDLPPELAAMGHAHHPMGGNPIPVTVTGALDDAPELGVVLRDRFMALGASARLAPLVLVAHGPSREGDVAAWVAGIRRATAPLTAAHAHAPIRIGLLRDDADPPVRALAITALRDTIRALAARAGDSVTVMTVLVSSGEIDRVKVPNDLVGLPMRYVGSVLAPHPALAEWIGRAARAQRARIAALQPSSQVDRERLANEERRHANHEQPEDRLDEDGAPEP